MLEGITATQIPFPHRIVRESIATPERGGNRVVGALTPCGSGSYSAIRRLVQSQQTSRCVNQRRKEEAPAEGERPQVQKADLRYGAMANIRVGPAGWSYSDWAGYVYPTPRPKGFHEATYLAQFFDTIEINTSFYQPLNPEHAKQWLDRVAANPRFVFTAKLWQKFTHDPTATQEDERAVRAGFDVLHKAGKLGAILLQFPFAFHRTAETTAYLESVLKRFADYPLAVEVRHATWNDAEVFALLREHQAAFCNIDQPLIGRSLEPSEETTSTIGYVRMHGRRYDSWFSDDPEVPQHERYNYLYSAKELAPWADRIKSIAEDTRNVFVITNNHYLGKAVVNALELISMLKSTKVEVPDPLRLRYPELETIAANPPQAPTLFALGSGE